MIPKDLSGGSDHIEGIDASRERPPSPTSANPVSPYLCNRGKRQYASLDPCGCGLVPRFDRPSALASSYVRPRAVAIDTCTMVALAVAG